MTDGKHSFRLPDPRNRLPFRLVSGLMLVVVLTVLGISAFRTTLPQAEPWFAGYVDVTVSPAYPFETPASDAAKNVILSFIVAGAANPCEPRWGPHHTLDEAGALLGLDAKLATLRENGGQAAISFGGAANTELATSCTDLPSLEDAYQGVVDRYGASTLDFDIEGANLGHPGAGARRTKAIAAVQEHQRSHGKQLEVWLTLPVSPRGLTDDGVAEVEAMLQAGIELAGVNIMTMNYGESRSSGQSMLQASETAAATVHSQLGIIYQRAGQELDSQALWAKLGLTPMIGLNEISTDVFDLETARQFAEFASENKVARMSMWSHNRDQGCRPGSPAPTAASHSCSGTGQASGAFAQVLGAPFTGAFR